MTREDRHATIDYYVLRCKIFEKGEKAVKKFLVALLVVGVLVGVAGAVYGKWNYAEKNHVHSKTELYETLKDGFYDNDYTMLSYTKRDTGELATLSRPIAVLFLDGEGQPIGREVLGMGILCETYVISRATLLNPIVAGITDSSLVASTRIVLVANYPITSEDDLEELKGFHVNLEKDYMILERQADAGRKLRAPVPEGCGFPIGSVRELSAGNALFQTGTLPALQSNINGAQVTFVSPDGSFIFQGAPGRNDSGAPLFALRDGHFELVGMNIGFFSSVPSKGFAMSVEDIIKEVRKTTGLDLLTGEKTK